MEPCIRPLHRFAVPSRPVNGGGNQIERTAMPINPLQVEAPSYMTEDLRIFEDGVDKFLDREAVPHSDRYIENHMVDRELWTKAGEAGLLCASDARGIWRGRRQLRP